MPSKNQLKKYLEFSQNLAKEVGQILLSEQNNFKVIKFKDRKDVATSADIKSEEHVIKNISKVFPDHSIFSEENGLIKKDPDYLWIIDPLDGTKEYLRGITLWNFSIALEYKGKLITSCIYRPFEKNFYYAALDIGSYLNNKKLKLSEVNKLSDSFVYCYLPSYFKNKQNYEKSFSLLSKIGKSVYRLRSMADENTALCWLAQGAMEAFINISNAPKWHDIAPGLLIAKEAGALIFDRYGNNLEKDNFKGVIVVNNNQIKNQLLKLL